MGRALFSPYTVVEVKAADDASSYGNVLPDRFLRQV